MQTTSKTYSGQAVAGSFDGPNLARFLGLAVLWGSAFTLIKICLEGLAPTQLVLGRLVLGASVLALLAVVTRVPLPRTPRVWGHICLAAGLSNALPFTLQAYGEQTTSASFAGVLLASIPLFTMAIATAALPTERISAGKAVGLLLGLAGVVVVSSPWNSAAGTLLGSVACLGAACSVGAGFVYARRFLSPLGLAPLTLAASQLGAAALLQVGVVSASGWPAVQLTGRVVLSMVLLGVVGTGVAYVLYFRLVGDLGATRTSSVSYVVPLVAVAVGVVLLGEAVTLPMMFGGVLVLIGMAIAEGRLRLPSRRFAPVGDPPLS